VTLYTWDTLFHVGRHNALVSKKEVDADNLIERAKFIVDNIPETEIPKECLPKYKRTYTRLEFPEIKSLIQAFPSGSDQLRAYGFSGVCFDEAAFMDDCEEAYSSTMPCIENGGRFTMISSPAKGFFHKLVFDNL